MFNENVPLSLGIGKERAKVIQEVTKSILESEHSDEERIVRLRDAFPRNEECIYAIYLLVPTKQEVAREMDAEDNITSKY